MVVLQLELVPEGEYPFHLTARKNLISLKLSLPINVSEPFRQFQNCSLVAFFRCGKFLKFKSLSLETAKLSNSVGWCWCSTKVDDVRVLETKSKQSPFGLRLYLLKQNSSNNIARKN